MEQVRAAAAAREQEEVREEPEAEAGWEAATRERVPAANACAHRAERRHPIRLDFPVTRWSVPGAVKQWCESKRAIDIGYERNGRDGHACRGSRPALSAGAVQLPEHDAGKHEYH
jgi:hypothetical protein